MTKRIRAPRPTKPGSAPAPQPAPQPAVPEDLPTLGELLTLCAQYLFEQGAVEMLALRGGAATIATERNQHDLDYGHWLLVRFNAEPAEREGVLLALMRKGKAG